MFLTGIDRLSDERLGWMFDMLAAGDPYGEVGAAIMAKELLREVYAARDLAHARRRPVVFFQHCADADVAELARLARTIDRWRDEVLAYHTTGGSSNGRVERPHARREDPPQRPRLRQPPQLPTAPHRTTRNQMGYRPNSQNQRPSTTLNRVEPSMSLLVSANPVELETFRLNLVSAWDLAG